MEPRTQPSSQEPSAELAYQYASTAANGITIGSSLTVPEGYAALVVMSSQPFDAVGPGEYTIDATAFPRLAQKLQLRPGEMPKKPIDITIFLMNVTEAVFPWRARPIVTKDTTNGLTFCDLAGRCAAKVLDPARFFSAMQAGLGRITKQQTAAARAQLAGMSVGKRAELFVGGVIGAASANSLASMRLAPEQFASAAPSVTQSISIAAAAALREIGLECTGFEVSNTPQLLRAPCSKCGSITAPTAYGFYRRTISLLYIRFGAHQEGNYCVPCAAKIWGSYCGVMLVCGWWGIIGLVLTPVYICQNTYYFLKTAFGKKVAAGNPADASEASAVWPQAPADDWGQEVQER